MFKRRSSSKENKDKARERNASAMGCVTGQNILPKTFNSFQEIQPLMQQVTELHERSGPAMDVLHTCRCCKDNQEMEGKIGMQAKEINALTDLAAEKELKITQLQELLWNLSIELSDVTEQRDRETFERWQLEEEQMNLERELYEMNIELESERRNCFVLTEEKRECDRLIAEQREDLLANQNYIEELNRRLKKELEQGEAVRQEKQTLNDTLKGERKKNEELKVKVQELSAFISDLTCKRESLQDQIRNLEDTVKRATQKTAGLEEDLMQVLQQFQGVGRHALGVHAQLMQDLMPCVPDAVRAVSDQGNTVDADTHQEPIETANHSTQLTNSRFPECPQLPANLPKVTMQILVYFTAQMGRKWKFIAYALGVEEQATLLADSQEAADSKCLTVLQTWIDQGPDVTWKKLVDALWGLGLRSTAIVVCEKLNQMADLIEQ